MRSAIFETWVLGETLKHRYNQGLSADLTFWRDNHGLEVDLVFEHTGRPHAVEIKSGATFVPDWFDASLRWRALAGTDAAPPLLVYGGDESFEFKGLGVMGWRELGVG